MAASQIPSMPQLGYPKKIADIPFWRRLRWNLTFYFVLLAIIPLGIVSFISLSQIRTQITQQVMGQLESVSLLKANQIKQWLESGEVLVSAVLDEGTSQTIIQVITTGDPKLQAEINKNLTDRLVGEGKGEKDDFSRIFNELFIYDTTGRVVSSSNPNNVGKSITGEPFFRPSLQADHFTQSPYYSPATNRLVMMHVDSIESEGKKLGVLAVEFNMDTLREILIERTGLGETGETYLVNLDKQFLTPSRFVGYTDLQKSYSSTGINAVVNKQTGQGTYPDYRGIPVLGSYRWIPELELGLLAEQDETEALAAAQTLRNTGIITAIIAGLIAIVIGFSQINRITRPLNLLTDAATQISAGDLALRAKVQQRNEIGQLAASFNQMTGQLESNIGKLNQKVKELDQANHDLAIASEQAKEAARLKSEFLATMSHELRTPLNAMIGFTGILLSGMDGEMDDSAKYMVERVEANSKRLLTLINDVLDISKIEAGRMEITERPTTLPRLVEQWRSQMSVLASQKGLEFTVQLDPSLPQAVLLDQERLTQVVVNLLSNAFKFTEKGSVQLSVGQETDQLVIRVKDTGIGIPSHALNYIFDEFRQVDGSWRRNYGGSGLGLAIVRNICRMMSGKVSVESTLGEGSTFTVQLPLKPTTPQISIPQKELVKV
jgi:two-component system sensor kinase